MNIDTIFKEKAHTVRKIELMHRLFGACDGQKCGDCNHFFRYGYHDRDYFKCEIYGNTCAESTDWRRKYQACGLFGKEYAGRDIVRLVGRKGYRIESQEPLEGQISFEVEN